MYIIKLKVFKLGSMIVNDRYILKVYLKFDFIFNTFQ